MASVFRGSLKKGVSLAISPEAIRNRRSVIGGDSKRTDGFFSQGAEATLFLNNNLITKKRISKSYRIKEIDLKIRKLRTRSEGKILEKVEKNISVPKIKILDEKNFEIKMEFIKGDKLSDSLNDYSEKKQIELMKILGKQISKLHQIGIVHGDLTTSNMISKNKKIYLVDFGLAFQNGKYENKAVDIHLFKQALEAKHFSNWKKLYAEFEKSYCSLNKEESQKVIKQLLEVEKRGRYKH